MGGVVPEHCNTVNVTPILKKGKKEDMGNYRPVSLTSVPGNVMEQLILEAISRNVKTRTLLEVAIIDL